MELVIIFYILFIIFLCALLVAALTGSKILKHKKDAIVVYSMGTIIYGTLFVLTLRLQLNGYDYVYVEPTNNTPINRQASSEAGGNNKGNPQGDGHEGKIKGNINKNTGEKIYHVPGSTYYDRTKAERWFNTEEEAKKAGYRAPKR
ncbi:putative membrane protein YttA [Clostridium liquoris]|uniref:Putative membrane protein YttA n=1 Tax=Clostridium liquoris TaxID=1289519 RepID=A0A2T0B1K9_9CLOT|nr:putative membrane protein YttA [Clostridium liquoris]